jgi:hypothetical protein
MIPMGIGLLFVNTAIFFISPPPALDGWHPQPPRQPAGGHERDALPQRHA